MSRPPTDVTLRRHPAERRAAPSVILPQFGCCCCCCCCLHALGSLVGGVVGSVTPIAEEPKPVDPDFPFPFRRDELENEPDFMPATALYWLLVLFVLACVPVWFFFDRSSPDSAFYGLLAGLFFLPLVQLGASVVCLIGIAIFYIDKANALRRLGQITLWSFVGALAGIGIMAGLCGLLMLH